MVILKSEGYSLMDTVAAIAIIGILVTLINVFISGLFENTDILYKREAALIARQVMYQSMNDDIVTDTVLHYSDRYRIERTVTYVSGERRLSVTVYKSSGGDSIVSFTVILN
jgi:type II secretory pathway component PulJ